MLCGMQRGAEPEKKISVKNQSTKHKDSESKPKAKEQDICSTGVTKAQW